MVDMLILATIISRSGVIYARKCTASGGYSSRPPHQHKEWSL